MIITQLLLGFDNLNTDNRVEGDFFVMDKVASRCGIVRKYQKFDLRNNLFYDQCDVFGERYYLGFPSFTKAMDFINFARANAKGKGEDLKTACYTPRVPRRLFGNACEVKIDFKPWLWESAVNKDLRDNHEYIKHYEFFVDFIHWFEVKQAYLELAEYHDHLEREFADLMLRVDLMNDYYDMKDIY